MKKLLIILFTFLFVSSQTFAADFNSCNTLYKDQNFKKAADCFYQLVTKDSSNVQARFYYAASLFYNKEYNDAYAQYNYIAQKYPNSQIGQYSKQEAAKVYKKIQHVQMSKQNDTGNYINELDKTAKWAKMPIKVWIQDSPYKATAQKAFGEWEVKTGKTVSFVQVQNPNFAQIKLNFVDKINNPISGDNIGLTNTKIWFDCITYAHIQILQRNDSGSMKTYNQVYAIVLHEIGHALGINGHSKRNNDIMYPSDYTNDIHLSNRDINTLKAIYKK